MDNYKDKDDKGHPWRTPRPILKYSEKYPLFPTQAFASEYSKFTHFIKSSPKLKCFSALYIKPWSTLSNAFSKSAKKNNPGEFVYSNVLWL